MRRPKPSVTTGRAFRLLHDYHVLVSRLQEWQGWSGWPISLHQAYARLDGDQDVDRWIGGMRSSTAALAREHRRLRRSR